MRAKKLFSILLAMMLMLFALFPIQAVLAETTNQPSQTTSTAEPPASSAVPTQRSDTPAPTSGAEPGRHAERVLLKADGGDGAERTDDCRHGYARRAANP